MKNKFSEQISESVSELKHFRSQTNNYRVKARIQSLILTKEKRFTSSEYLANHLGIDVATLRRWKAKYLESGLEEFLKIRNGGKRYSHVSSDLHEALLQKAHNSEDPFMSYIEAVQWVKEHHDQTIKYTTLRSYLVDNFKTKVKKPRKSHYKKDEQAIAAFKKTS